MTQESGDRAIEPHRVVILVLADVITLDLAVPAQVFGPWPPYLVADDSRLVNPYSLVLCGPESESRSGNWLVAPGIRPLAALREADTIVVPGCADPLRPTPENVLSELVAAAERGARVISTCLGAFVLAEAGLLDGRRATTHWRWADELRRRYPKVDVQEQHLYIDDGNVLTSAGVLAATDLCLYVIGRDAGQLVANAVARFLVSPPHRDGGQAQFVRHPVAVSSGSLSGLRQWLLENLTLEHTLRSIADHAKVSTRTLTRRFYEETGETVMNWLTLQRVVRARTLLEESGHSVSAIAHQAGFGSVASLRVHFQELTGTSPQQYRRTFRISPAAEPVMAVER